MAKRFLADKANDLFSLAQILGRESLNTTRRYSLNSANDQAQQGGENGVVSVRRPAPSSVAIAR
jgi:hypothetical protein